MKITYDPNADAVYIYLQPDKLHKRGVAKNTRGDYPIHLDFMDNGHLFGIEILEASKMIDIDNLKRLDFEEYR